MKTQSDLREAMESSKRILLLIQSNMTKVLARLTREKAAMEHRVTVAEFRSNIHLGEKRRLEKALRDTELSKDAEIAGLSAKIAEMKPHYDEGVARGAAEVSRMARRLAEMDKERARMDKEREELKKALETKLSPSPAAPLLLTAGRP
jgi:hypothetical protein